MKLNLGSGIRPQKEYINVDKEPLSGPDVLLDLETTPWPWADNSIEEVLAVHVLEHLGQVPSVFIGVMKEIYRILEPGGLLIVKVPHHNSDGYFGDPTHVRPITPLMLSLFSKKHCRLCVEKGWPNTPIALYYDIDLELEKTNLDVTGPWGQRFHDQTLTQTELDHACESYNNVINEVTMQLRKIE